MQFFNLRFLVGDSNPHPSSPFHTYDGWKIAESTEISQKKARRHLFLDVAMLVKSTAGQIKRSNQQLYIQHG